MSRPRDTRRDMSDKICSIAYKISYAPFLEGPEEVSKFFMKKYIYVQSRGAHIGIGESRFENLLREKVDGCERED